MPCLFLSLQFSQKITVFIMSYSKSFKSLVINLMASIRQYPVINHIRIQYQLSFKQFFLNDASSSWQKFFHFISTKKIMARVCVCVTCRQAIIFMFIFILFFVDDKTRRCKLYAQHLLSYRKERKENKCLGSFSFAW